MNLSLIVTIAVIAVLVIFLVIGLCRGFLRIILTTFSLIITLVLVSAFAGPAADFVENSTVVGPRLQSHIQEYVDSQLSSLSTSAADAETALIEALPLPDSMKTDLKSKNTMAGYVDQGVTSFSQYLSVNLTSLVIKLLCYVILFIVIYLILRLILRLSNLVNHIPVLGGVNRILGGVLGLVEGVLFLWVICMIIMMMSGTSFGMTCEEVISGSKVLTFIYEHNYLMLLVNTVVGIFKFW